jgi:hypothetical protein
MVKRKSTSHRLSNQDLFLYAMSEAGGNKHFVHVEEIYLKMHELFPHKFSWRTRPDIPHYRNCAHAQEVAEEMEPKPTIKNGPYKRKFSEAGQQWLATNQKRLAIIIKGQSAIPEPPQREASRAVRNLRATEAFTAWQDDTDKLPEQDWQIAELLRCSPISEISEWKKRLEALKSDSSLAADDEVTRFLNALSNHHKALFEGENDDN